MATIGMAARESGIAIETIRYYERTGVVAPPPRTDSGQRDYGPAEIARLTMIRRCRDLGFPLADVRALLTMAAEKTACAEVKALAEGHLAEIRQKQRDLAAIEAALSELLASCAGGSCACPALDTLAQGSVQ